MSKTHKARIYSKLETLERRADFLAKRISTSDTDLSYDKQELSALRWALDVLRPQFSNRTEEKKTCQTY